MALITNFSSEGFDTREFEELAQSVSPRAAELTEASAPVVIEGLHNNEHWAWRLLTDHYQPALERFAANKKMTDPSALAGTTLHEFARSITSFRGTDKRALDAYVFRTARNRVIDEFRKKRVETVPLAAEVVLADPNASSIEGDVAGEQWVDEVLDLLSSDQRRVVELRILEDKSVAETALLLDKNPGTVQVIQHRAIRVLRMAIAAAAVLLALFGLRWATEDGVRVVTPDPAERPETRSGPTPDGDPPVADLNSVDNEGDVPIESEAPSESEASLIDEEQYVDEPSGVSGDPEAGQGEDPATGADVEQPDIETPATTDVQATSGPDEPAEQSSARPAKSAAQQTPATSAPAVPRQASPDPVETTIAQSATTVAAQQPQAADKTAEAPAASTPATTSAPTTVPVTAAQIAVAAPTGCEVQISGVGTTGVEVHEPSEIFADSYQLLGLGGTLIAEVSNPQQEELGEIEFEAIPNGFDPALVFSVAAVNDGVISDSTSCIRRGSAPASSQQGGAVGH